MTRFPFNGHEGGGQYDIPRKLDLLRAVTRSPASGSRFETQLG